LDEIEKIAKIAIVKLWMLLLKPMPHMWIVISCLVRVCARIFGRSKCLSNQKQLWAW